MCDQNTLIALRSVLYCCCQKWRSHVRYSIESKHSCPNNLTRNSLHLRCGLPLGLEILIGHQPAALWVHVLSTRQRNMTGTSIIRFVDVFDDVDKLEVGTEYCVVYVLSKEIPHVWRSVAF